MEKPLSAYSGDEPYSFVCYSHADSEIVFPELAWLNDNGCNIWYDEGIRPGKEWTDELAHAIENAGQVVFFVTPTSVKSRYCRDEVYYAIEADIPVITVYLEAAKLTRGLSLSLGKTHALNKYELDFDIYRDRLLTYLQHQLPFEKVGGTGSTRELSIAVLPFANMSDEKSNEYFSDGISDEIIAALVKTGKIPVIARTSSFQFKGVNEDISRIGSLLKVSHLVEGSVRKAGNNVRINAQLVEAETGRDVWSNRYQGVLDNIFELQDEIATAIVAGVQSKLLGGMDNPAANNKTRTTSLDAYDLYLRAEASKVGYSPGQLDRALDLYQQSLALDPQFVDAWIGFAFTHLWRTFEVIAAEVPTVAYEEVSHAVQQVLNIDAQEPRALFLEGYLSAVSHHNWIRGFRLMEKAIGLSPQDSELLTLYGLLLDYTRQPRASEFLERAYRLDPLSIAVLFLSGFMFRQGRQQDAVAIIQPLLLGNQNNYLISVWIGFLHIMLMQFDVATKHLDYARKFVASDCTVLRTMELWQARLQGDQALAERIGKDLLTRSGSERVPYLFAPWVGDAMVEIFDRLLEWNDVSLIGPLIQDKPELFTEAQWLHLREEMNIDELMESTVKGMFKTRSISEKKELLARRIPVDQQAIRKMLGIYEGAYQLDFSEHDEEVWLKCSLYGIEGLLIPTQTNHFQLLSEAIWIEFLLNESGSATGCILHQSEVSREFKKTTME